MPADILNMKKDVQTNMTKYLLKNCLFWAALVCGLILLSGCPPKPVVITEDLALELLPRGDYPQFRDDGDYGGLADSIDMSLSYLQRLPGDRLFGFGPDTYSAAHLIASLEAFSATLAQSPDVDELNRLVAQRFRVYQATGVSDDKAVLYTGYYEPILQGSLNPSAEYSVPLYARPSDLMVIDLTPFAADLEGRHIVGRYNGRTVEPYPQRAAIRARENFQRLAPPIAWVREEFDLFNLQVQGSGKVALEDGTILNVHFDGSNGHPYRSIGRLLIAQGKIPSSQLSMQAIREYLRDHPDELHEILNHNPRYVFFRLVDQGPIGALGVPLTARRSIAVDRTRFPMAALAFISTDVPLVKENSDHSEPSDQVIVAGKVHYSGFALVQDTGSAITGPGRADFFWGSGLQAEAAAGHMKYRGQLFFLVLDPDADIFLN